MPKPVSLATIVRDFPEPGKTALLERLLQEARAFVITYQPRKGCPEYRRKEMAFDYGIPKRRMVFVADKPKAVDLGLAVFILNQFQPRVSKLASLSWGEEWHVSDDDPIIVERLPDDLGDAQAARERALEKLDEKKKDFEDEETEADAGGPPLGRLSKPELVVVFTDEVGHKPSPEDFDGEKVTIARLLTAIRENRAEALEGEQDDDSDATEDEDGADEDRKL